MAFEIRFPEAAEVPEGARVDGARHSRRWLVDGEVRRWDGAVMPVESAVCLRGADGSLTRAVIGELPALGEKEALLALEAAKKAWDKGRGAWPTMRVGARIEAMEKFVAEMARTREDVVRLLMWEIAKTRKDAETEFDRTMVYIRDTLEALKQQDRDNGRFVIEEGTIGQVRRSPLGVVLSMGPFNYPLNETFTTLIPALVMGNTVVAKLPKYGGMSIVPLLDAFASCFPPGVVNVIQGDGATIVGPIMTSGDVDCLAFIGSARVCNLLKRQHPHPNRLRAITGMGAKNPAFVLPHADLEVAVRECASGALSYNGQRCTAIKMIHVHKDVASEFQERFVAAVGALKAGVPWEPGARITPLPEHGKPEALKALADRALASGARLLNAADAGGTIAGTFYAPAVLGGVEPAMEIAKVEQFGPLVPIDPFESDEEMIDLVTRSPFGQQCAIFGQDPARIARLVDALVNQVSRINLNTQCRRGPDTFPFTGRKDSAEGTLSVTDALRAFSIRAVVATSADPANKELVGEIVTRRLSQFLSTDFLF